MEIEILHIFISPAHSFAGRHGQDALDHPMVEVPEVECVAGRGLRGDRYFDHQPDYKGQVTFFAHETHEAMIEQFALHDLAPSVYRRNIITRGVDLNSLIDEVFEVQGVRFFGMEEAKPCYWMDRAVGEGALRGLTGRGGLRARILSDGVIQSSALHQPLAR